MVSRSLIVVVSVLILPLSTFAQIDTSECVPGMISFYADTSVIKLPHPMVGLVMKTANQHEDYMNGGRTTGVESIQIDSVLYVDSDQRVVTQLSTDSLSIRSEELQQIVVDFGVTRIMRTFPHFTPGDTLVRNRVTYHLVPVPDLSFYWRLSFDTSMSWDSVAAGLRLIEGIKDVERVPKRVP